MNTCKVIAIENQKGGTGKSTTALNLGVGLSQAGKSVLLIDSDPQASLTLSLGVMKPDELKVNLATVMMRIINDHAYDIIKKLQSELPDKGRSEPSGRIPRKFLMSKLYGEDTEDTEEKDGPMDL